MSSHPLEYVFRPRSVAIVGASTLPIAGTGGGFLASILDMGFRRVHDIQFEFYTALNLRMLSASDGSFSIEWIN